MMSMVISMMKMEIDKLLKDGKAAIRDRYLMDDKLEQDLEEIYSLMISDINKEVGNYVSRYGDVYGVDLKSQNQKVDKKTPMIIAALISSQLKLVNDDEAKRRLGLIRPVGRNSTIEGLFQSIDIISIRYTDIGITRVSQYIDDLIVGEVKRLISVLNLDLLSKKEIKEKYSDFKFIPYKGGDFSDYIWKNQRELTEELKRLVQRSVLQGENPRKWAVQLQKYLRDTEQNAVYSTNRIAITEGSRAQGIAALEVLNENNYKKYMFIAEDDERVCPHCQALDGEVFYVQDAVAGDNYYPMHPLCRCSAAAYSE